MKRSLGISIYPEHSTVEKDKEYLLLASQYGFTRVFTCLLSVNKPKEEVIIEFKETIEYAKSLGYEVILDVAPSVFEQLGISYDNLDFFHQMGATGIRLDLGFDGAKEAMLTFNEYQLAIEINMSNNVAYLDNILTYQPATPFLYGCHNFYPQKGTGLEYEFFVQCSKRFKKHGIRTAAFINSHTASMGPWSINDGLCTLEMHRDLPIDIQAKHLFATNLIDDVIIGNAYASKAELEMLSKVNRYQLELTVMTIDQTSELEKQIMFNEQHYRRGDITKQAIRSTEVRKKQTASHIELHDYKDVFHIGDIVIGNNNFGKYKGELQIILEDCRDERKNKVGRVIDNEMFLLDYVDAWTKFKLKEMLNK
ncbi:MAG: MupG family TIM beta-alpha barrel fold protein [Coprobacillus sp.]